MNVLVLLLLKCQCGTSKCNEHNLTEAPESASVVLALAWKKLLTGCMQAPQIRNCCQCLNTNIACLKDDDIK